MRGFYVSFMLGNNIQSQARKTKICALISPDLTAVLPLR